VNSQDWVEPFVAATMLTLREMAGLEATACETDRISGTQRFGDLSALLRLSAGGEGYLALDFPRPTATALAARILDGAAEINEEMVRDCAGEVANVVAGQAKALLFGTPDHFTFSLPSVTVGPAALPVGVWWVVSFVSEVGPFRLHLLQPR